MPYTVLGQASWVTEFCPVERRKTQSGFLKSQACVLQIIPASSMFFGLLAPWWPPAPCSLVHHTTATSLLPRSLSPITRLLPPAPETPRSAPKSAEPGWFLGRISPRSSLLEGHWWLVPSWYSNAVHSFPYDSLSSTKGRQRVPYKDGLQEAKQEAFLPLLLRVP